MRTTLDRQPSKNLASDLQNKAAKETNFFGNQDCRDSDIHTLIPTWDHSFEVSEEEEKKKKRDSNVSQ